MKAERVQGLVGEAGLLQMVIENLDIEYFLTRWQTSYQRVLTDL
jgi:hypothetical protein